MANSEKNRSRSGVGWLSRLILLSVVIGFGYLYLQSIEREGGDGAASLLDSIAKLSPIPISALPGAGQQQKQVTAAAGESAVEVVATPASKPVSEAESRAFASSLAPSLPQPAPAKSAPTVVAAPVPAPAPVASVPARQAVVPTAPATSVATQPAGSPAAGSSAQPNPFDWQSAMAEQQARAMARYEAERRAMEERARQYWEQARAATPVPPPQGYPGFLPPYPPPYPPAVYAPPR